MCKGTELFSNTQMTHFRTQKAPYNMQGALMSVESNAV